MLHDGLSGGGTGALLVVGASCVVVVVGSSIVVLFFVVDVVVVMVVSSGKTIVKYACARGVARRVLRHVHLAVAECRQPADWVGDLAATDT